MPPLDFKHECHLPKIHKGRPRAQARSCPAACAHASAIPNYPRTAGPVHRVLSCLNATS